MARSNFSPFSALLRNPAQAPMLLHAALLLRLEKNWNKVVPAPYQELTRVRLYRPDGTLVIQTPVGAVAKRLQQMAPTLARKLQEQVQQDDVLKARDVPVLRVEVVVRAEVDTFEKKKVTPKDVPPPAADALHALAQRVSQPGLRDALERLASRRKAGQGTD